MKKRNTKTIAASLGIGALTGGIAVAAVAQGCVQTPTTEQRVAEIVSTVNEFNSYTSSTMISGGLPTQLLNAINVQVNIELTDSTLETLMFEEVTADNVVSSSDGSQFDLEISNVTGTISSSSVQITGVLSIGVQVVNGGLTISTNNGVGLMFSRQPIAISEFIMELNNGAIRNYQTGAPPGTMFQSNVINSILNDIEGTTPNVIVDDFSYSELLPSDVTVNGEGLQTQYVVMFSGATGSGNIASTAFTVSGQGVDSTFSITFSNIAVTDVNDIQVSATTGLQRT